MLKGRENRKIVAIYEVTETYKKCWKMSVIC